MCVNGLLPRVWRFLGKRAWVSFTYWRPENNIFISAWSAWRASLPGLTHFRQNFYSPLLARCEFMCVSLWWMAKGSCEMNGGTFVSTRTARADSKGKVLCFVVKIFFPSASSPQHYPQFGLLHLLPFGFLTEDQEDQEVNQAWQITKKFPSFDEQQRVLLTHMLV